MNICNACLLGVVVLAAAALGAAAQEQTRPPVLAQMGQAGFRRALPEGV